MDNLISVIWAMIGAMIVILAFCMGVWTGSRFLCHGTGNSDIGGKHCRNVSEDISVGDIVSEECPDDSSSVTTEEEKRLIREQQKALEQCMSYSVDMAYGTIHSER